MTGASSSLTIASRKGIREIRYRIVVDGLWMADPANPLTDTDAAGVSFSVYTLEKEPFRTIVNPKQVGNQLQFVFHGTSGRRVFLVGDFNNWDRSMYPLDETAPGTGSSLFRVRRGVSIGTRSSAMDGESWTASTHRPASIRTAIPSATSILRPESPSADTAGSPAE